MSKKSRKPWPKERYALALKGYMDIPGLRRTVEGFDAVSGYDLRSFDTWSKSRKARIRDYDERVHLLLAQERKIVYPRSKEVKSKLQAAFHGEVASKKFKAVFVPYVQPKVATEKQTPVKITYTKTGITIHNGGNARHFEPFDQYGLATDPKKEIKRAVKAMPGAKLFYVQVNEFQTLNGADAPSITAQVLKYVERYDGVRSLRGTRHAGDNPKDHHYRKWMTGLVGYEFTGDFIEMNRKVVKGILAAKEKRHAADVSKRKAIKSKRSK